MRALRPPRQTAAHQEKDQTPHIPILSSHVRRAECLQAPPRGLQFRISAAFLLDEVVLDSAAVLGGLENAFPVGLAFPKQRLVADVWDRATSPYNGWSEYVPGWL